ncbi:MAG: A24 family peptidase [Candidatus Tyrphobacter sp.]
MPLSPAHGVALALGIGACGLAVCTDLRSRRVPNTITLPLLAAAVVLALFDGRQAALVACAIVAAGLVAGTIVHAAGILGGGDVKLLTGVGALAGYPVCIEVAIYCALCGGILALAVSAVRGELPGVLSRVRCGVAGAIGSRSLSLGAASVAARGPRIPYAVAIASGFIIALLGVAIFPALRIVQ